MDETDKSITLIYLRNYLLSATFNDNQSLFRFEKWVKNNKDYLFTQDQQILLASEMKKRKKLVKPKKDKKIINYDLSTSREMILVDTLKDFLLNLSLPKNFEDLGNSIQDADYIAKVFDLSEVEKDFVRHLCSINRIEILDNLSNTVMDNLYYIELEYRKNENLEKLGNFLNRSTLELEIALGPKSGLFKCGLLIFSDDKSVGKSSSFTKLIRERSLFQKDIKNILLTKNSKTTLVRDDFDHIKDDYDLLFQLFKNALLKKEEGINVLLHGPPGTGKTELTKTLCSELGANLYSIMEEDQDEENEYNSKNANRIAQLEITKSLLKGDNNSIIIFDEAEDIFGYYGTEYFESKRSSKSRLNHMMENNKNPIIWITNSPISIDPSQLRRFTFILSFKIPPAETREIIWERLLNKNGITLTKDEIQALSNEYEIPPSFATNAIKVAKLIDNKTVIKNVLDKFSEITTVTRKAPPPIRDEPFLIELLNTNVNLVELTEQITSKGQMNFSLCLYGHSGTGKSEYVKYLSEKLQLPVLKKRMSDLLGMYVGENEKNIAEAFKEALDKKMFLLFDEADSCLLDRSYAVSSWEVRAVNEMLTWMESHSLPFACTTNLMDRVDKASLRRFTFKVKFEYLTPLQTSVAFKHFFGINKKVNIDNLTPSDFVLAAKKSSILGLNKEEEFIEMLKREVKAKNEKITRIRFFDF